MPLVSGGVKADLAATVVEGTESPGAQSQIAPGFQQRHLRLYGTRNVCPEPIEVQSLNLHSPPVEPMVANKQNRYSQLPLAF
jgi:hypothetical protein